MGKKLVFAVLTIAFGAFAGAFAWAFFFLMNTGIDLLWVSLPASLAAIGIPTLLFPLGMCIVGGLAIGLFAKRFGPYPQTMNEVMAQVKKTGRYEYDKMGPSFLGALLPLLFGGSIGPEAGLTGVIAGLCTWVGDRLRFAGAEMRELAEAGTAAVITAIFSTPLFGLAVPAAGMADGSEGPRTAAEIRLDVPKPLKAAVYILAAAGALGAMMLLGSLFGHGGGLPRFSDMALGPSELLWGVPLALVGAAAGWLFFPLGAAVRRLSAALGDRPVAKAVIAGTVLGACGTLLPFTLFAGEAQTEILAETWTALGAGVLVATGFLKILATQFCLNLGWRGGHFFPLIFAGIAIGYGLAGLMGVDPVFALCAVTGALLGAVMRQPVMTALLLFLVFPVKGAIVLLVAAALGSILPVPARWREPEA